MAEHRIETRIDIDAPPSRVWAMLTDFPAMSGWNPFIRSISGELTQGGLLSAVIGPPGKSGMRFRPTVLVVRPEQELRWKGPLFIPGLCDGEHYFLLEPNGTGVRFTHGELFSGRQPSSRDLRACLTAMPDASGRQNAGAFEPPLCPTPIRQQEDVGAAHRPE